MKNNTKRCALEVLAWGMMEAKKQFAEADNERPQAEEEDNPFLVKDEKEVHYDAR